MSPGLRVAAFLPAALIILPLAGFALGAHIPSAFIIFSLLLGLMLTGMPISIALGLIGAHVPVHDDRRCRSTSVALKLFTGIEKFEIMAIPFFILAGNFLTHGGVARRMINFATSMVGHWYGGWPGRRGGLRAVRGGLRARRRPRWWRSARSCCRPCSSRASRARFGAGVITTSGALGILCFRRRSSW